MSDSPNMAIRLIVCDIEGCLMPADKGAARPESLAPIADYCHAARVDTNLPPLVFCTGRQAPYAECLAQTIGAFFPGFPSIVENGAFLYDFALNRITASPLIDTETAGKRNRLVSIIDPWLIKTGAVREPGKDVCISLNPPTGQSIESFYTDVKDFLGAVADGFNINHSRSAVDITPIGIDKAHGVKELAKITGIDPTEMLGIGDTSGDMPMLNLAGLPTCPANATDEVKAIAKYIANTTESAGVIEIIRHFTDWRSLSS